MSTRRHARKTSITPFIIKWINYLNGLEQYTLYDIVRKERYSYGVTFSECSKTRGVCTVQTCQLECIKIENDTIYSSVEKMKTQTCCKICKTAGSHYKRICHVRSKTKALLERFRIHFSKIIAWTMTFINTKPKDHIVVWILKMKSASVMFCAVCVCMLRLLFAWRLYEDTESLIKIEDDYMCLLTFTT